MPNLSTLVNGLEGFTLQGDAEVSGFVLDSRKARHGDVFVALNGHAENGLTYVEDALKRGAVAVLADDGAALPSHVECALFHADVRAVLPRILNRFYTPKPECLVGVTGSNGKTSVASFAMQWWALMGKKSASIGTLGIATSGNNVIHDTGLTSPDVITMHKSLEQLNAAGVHHVAMEASSHGLDQNRMGGIKMSAAAFTNLSHEHLDYHGSMENYLAAKTKLFTQHVDAHGVAVINADVPEFEVLKKAASHVKNILCYGYNAKNIKLLSVTPTSKGQQVNMQCFGKHYEATLPLIGEFQVMNVLCAMGLLHATGSHMNDLVQHMPKLTAVPGRMEWVRSFNGAPVIVDYAHTPDALEKALSAARPFVKGTLYVVFGCGGERDVPKRALMGEVAQAHADKVVITDDNPRNEEASSIRHAILSKAKNAIEIGDRKEAIKHAMKQLKAGDVLLIAGKGHEDYQIIGSKKHPFSDQEEVRNVS